MSQPIYRLGVTSDWSNWVYNGTTYTSSLGETSVVATMTGSYPEFTLESVTNLTGTALVIDINAISTAGAAFKSDDPNFKVVANVPITTIGANAFANTGLTSIVIPSTVTEIGASAFAGLTGLTTVVFPSGTSPEFLDGLKIIGELAFEGCTGLTSVILPYGLTTVGASAFAGCTALDNVVLPVTVTEVEIGALAGYTGVFVALCANVGNLPATGYYDPAVISTDPWPNTYTALGGITNLSSAQKQYVAAAGDGAVFTGTLTATSGQITNTDLLSGSYATGMTLTCGTAGLATGTSIATVSTDSPPVITISPPALNSITDGIFFAGANAYATQFGLKWSTWSLTYLSSCLLADPTVIAQMQNYSGSTYTLNYCVGLDTGSLIDIDLGDLNAATTAGVIGNINSNAFNSAIRLNTIIIPNTVTVVGSFT